MPTMTIPSANMRRLKKLAAEAAAKSSSSSSSMHRALALANLRRRSPPPPSPPRRETRVVAGGDATFGARVLVRAPAASSAGMAAHQAPLALPTVLVRAVVVSAADEDGYLEVVYEGAPPPGRDPFATVRVPRDRIVVADTPQPVAIDDTCSASGGVAREASSPPGDAETESLKMLARAAIM